VPRLKAALNEGTDVYSPNSSLTLKNDDLPALELTVTRTANPIDVCSMALSRVLNGRAAVLPGIMLHMPLG
jgi:hypothetical protein